MRKSLLYLPMLLIVALVGCSEEANVDQVETTEENPYANLRQLDDETLRSYFEPLGEVSEPSDNPITEEKIELGMLLFADPRLSVTNDVSCLTCHSPNFGYSDGLAKSIGIHGQIVARNAPTVINTGYYDVLFWDGRATTLEQQALGPLTDAKEMGNDDLEAMVEEIKNIEGYKPYFDKAFDGEITLDNILKAIGTFQRSINIVDTPFDRFIAGDDNALTDEEKFGMEIFVDKGSCITCHSGPNFTDLKFYNIGVETDDEGLAKLTGNPEDKGKFRTPGLRGVADSGPYKHNGSMATLMDVVEFYDRGGDGDENTSPLIKPLGLTDQEKDALVAFMRAISGEVPQIEIPELPN